jgi:hypothetical protein
MAQYLVLIYEDESGYAKGGQEVYEQVMKAHNEFAAKHGASLRSGNALQPVASATSIRKDASGSPAITDGPFAETKEALGGYYLIEADDLDQAIAIARDVPALFGGVEVRPIMVFD